MSNPWQAFQQDIQRYGGWLALFKEQSLWAIAWFRLGTALNQIPVPILRKLTLMPWWFIFRFVEMLTGVSLPVGAQIGPGLRIWHFGGVFVNSASVIGANCTLRQGVTIGNRYDGGGAPTIGDGVDIGAYAQLLGEIRIGDHAKIGAMSVVLSHVPTHAVAIGIPAKIKTAGAAPADNALAEAQP